MTLNRLLEMAQVTLNRPPSPDVDLSLRISRRRRNSDEDEDDDDDDDTIVDSESDQDYDQLDEEDSSDGDDDNADDLSSSDGIYLPSNTPYHIPAFCEKDYMHTDSLWDDIVLRGFLPLQDATNGRCAYADISSASPSGSIEENNVRISRIIGAALALSQSKV